MCNCGAPNVDYTDYRIGPKKKSPLVNRWILDDKGRKLLISSSIYDSYNDIIGYVTRNEKSEVIRIFEKNIKKILD